MGTGWSQFTLTEGRHVSSKCKWGISQFVLVTGGEVLNMVARGWLSATLRWLLAQHQRCFADIPLLAGHQTDPLPEGIHLLLDICALFSQMKNQGHWFTLPKWTYETRHTLSLLWTQKDAPEVLVTPRAWPDLSWGLHQQEMLSLKGTVLVTDEASPWRNFRHWQEVCCHPWCPFQHFEEKTEAKTKMVFVFNSRQKVAGKQPTLPGTAPPFLQGSKAPPSSLPPSARPLQNASVWGTYPMGTIKLETSCVCSHVSSCEEEWLGGFQWRWSHPQNSPSGTERWLFSKNHHL